MCNPYVIIIMHLRETNSAGRGAKRIIFGVIQQHEGDEADENW